MLVVPRDMELDFGGFGNKAGFERPILHGLCTYRIACQSLIRAVCGGDAAGLAGMGARFTRPVYPGDTLRTGYWRNGDAVQFRCSIAALRNCGPDVRR